MTSPDPSPYAAPREVSPAPKGPTEHRTFRWRIIPTVLLVFFAAAMTCGFILATFLVTRAAATNASGYPPLGDMYGGVLLLGLSSLAFWCSAVWCWKRRWWHFALALAAAVNCHYLVAT